MSATSLGAQREAAAILARLDRLPATRTIWTMVALLSLGGVFEFYDLFMTGYVNPALMKAGLMKDAGLPGTIFVGAGLFPAATFAGLFLGTFVFSVVADLFGRRLIFTISMLWYCAATLVMAFQETGNAICLWRLIAGIGIGVELVTIDTYIAELVPKHLRGRSFAFNQTVQFAVVPIVAFISYQLVPTAPLGFDGWRWVALIGAVGALFVWFLRAALPESPRWLLNHNRLNEADAVTAAIEARVQADRGGVALPAPAPHETERLDPSGSFAEILRPPYAKRTLMLVIFQFFQTFGFYGFANWVPTLIAAQIGQNITQNLEYAFIIAIANPFGPMLAILFADRTERKYQLVGAAIGVALFGIAFSQQTDVTALIVCGVGLTLCNNILSYAFHGYQTELFPTRVRARAVGFTYSFSRVSTIFVSFFIAKTLAGSESLGLAGSTGVFALIAFAMLMVVLSIGLLGPRTRNLELEQISH